MSVQSPGSARVLIVEDDPSVSEFLAAAVRDTGVEVRVTADAAEASRLVVGGGFDLVILDYHVRGGTGMDVARALRAGGGATPIIFLSGSWMPDMRVEAERIPSVIILDKPVDLAGLQQAVRRLLGPAQA